MRFRSTSPSQDRPRAGTVKELFGLAIINPCGTAKGTPYAMLCPECRISAKGGSLCPSCGQRVPEEERFGGQGGHYLRVFLSIGVGLSLVAIGVSSLGVGVPVRLSRAYEQGSLWPYWLILIVPAVIGFYHWWVLREEEITITDTYIARRSHWGNQLLRWDEVHSFHVHSLGAGLRSLGKMGRLSRYLSQERIHWKLPVLCYDLEGPPERGDEGLLRLEPGTIDDLPWLIALIEEHLGPPEEAGSSDLF